MRIRMLTTQLRYGDGEESRDNGQEYDVPEKEAKALLERGDAEPVARKGSDRAEKRVVGAAETR